jgi:hypothetical protein
MVPNPCLRATSPSGTQAYTRSACVLESLPLTPAIPFSNCDLARRALTPVSNMSPRRSRLSRSPEACRRFGGVAGVSDPRTTGMRTCSRRPPHGSAGLASQGPQSRRLEPQHDAGRETCERDELLTEPGSVNISKLRLEVPHVGVDVQPWPQSNEDAPACVYGGQRRLG